MRINGMEQIRKHVPDLNTPRGRAQAGLYPLGLVRTGHFVLRDFRPHPHMEH